MRTLFLTLLTVAVALSGRAAESTIPKATAAHFCQLLVQDAEGRIKSLGAFANGDVQLFSEYVFRYDGWHDLRIFPHGDRWYAATDLLPSSVGHEHQRYIQEVFPRIIREAQAGHWAVVDEYIDRMLQYQQQFAPVTPIATPAAPLPVPLLLSLVFALFLLIPLLAIRYSASRSLRRR